MKTFAINTLGCKVNQYESQQVRQLLEQLGLKQVHPEQKPDLSLINTCCVTHTASAKSRQCIRKARKINKAALVVAYGCLPAFNSNELADLGSNLVLIRHRSSIALELSQIVAAQTNTTTPRNTDITSIKPLNPGQINPKNLADLPKLPELTAFKGQTRAFLKVQDGCDGRCSYCIIPACRPDVQSKSVPDVLHEAQMLVKAGHKEIVLTGIFLGAFGQRTTRSECWQGAENPELIELLEKLAKIPGLARIRLSSLAPSDVTENLLDTLCAYPNILPHLHLSMQSGSDRILRRMCRQYSAEQFRRKVELIKSRLDRPAITTDVIVGFPSETDEDFEQTLGLAREVGFARIHIFSFSPRQGTAAAKMKPKVKSEIVKHRAAKLQELANELAYQYRQQFLGQTAEVLIENIDENGTALGRAERYFEVRIPNAPREVHRNDLVEVTLTANTHNCIIGCLFDA